MKFLRYLAVTMLFMVAAQANSSSISTGSISFPTTRASLANLSAASSATGLYQHMYISESGYQAIYDWSVSANQTCSVASYIAPDNSYICPSDVSPPATGRWVRSQGPFNYSLEQFGGGASVSNNTPAMLSAISALSAAGGGTLMISTPGTYTLVPTAGHVAAGYMFSVPNNVTIACSSQAVVLQLGSTSQTAMFRVLNPNNDYIGVNCTGRGNGVATIGSTAGFVEFIADGTATGAMRNFGTPGLLVKNWKQTDIIRTYNNSIYPMSNVNLDNVGCVGNVGFNATSINACITMRAQYAASTGTVSGISLRNVYGDGTNAMSAFYASWNASDAVITGGNFSNFCQGQDPSTVSCHTVFSYEIATGFDTRPHGFSVVNSTFTASKARHIYCYKTDDCYFNANTLDGIPDGTGEHQPSGIFFNDASGIASNNNWPNGNSYNPDILVVTDQGMDVTLENNTSRNANTVSSGADFGIEILASSGTSDPVGTSTTNLINNHIERTTTGGQAIHITSTTGNGVGTINVVGGQYISGGYTVYGQDSGGSTALLMNRFTATDAYFRGRYYAISLLANSSPIVLSNLVIDGTGSIISPLALNNDTNLMLSNILIQNVSATPASATDFTGVCGSVSGIQFRNVAAPRGVSGTPGLVAPTCSAAQGTFFQNLLPSGAGHLHGWTNTNGSTTWTED